MKAPIDLETEWLEADGLGGFASGTTLGIPTRRYHALLLVAAQPPSDRFVLVNSFVAWLEHAGEREQLTRHYYAPGVTTRAAARVVDFVTEPWPSYRWLSERGLAVRSEVIAERGAPSVLLRFELETPRAGVKLCLRPLLSGRDYHHLHHENSAFRFTPEQRGALLTFRPYPGVPAIFSASNGHYCHSPEWYRNLRYLAEQERGLDCDEDLASPGVLEFDLANGAALWWLSADTPRATAPSATDVLESARSLRDREQKRRSSYSSSLSRAADAYLVQRGAGRSIVAGYPWFSDWGRDSFIALRGLCIAQGRLAEARDILLEWSSAVSQGMLPNRFPDRSGVEPEYNAVDASLWYAIAASELLAHPDAARVLSADDARRLRATNAEIVRGYARGTRFGIRRDADGLLAAGEAGVQLTWMDAKVGDYVVTPRRGKPVEVQALWLNALYATRALGPEFERWFAGACESFEARFWNPAQQALYDVVDVDHRPGALDASIRPNQIFAAGGLPFTPLPAARARRIVDVVEDRLWTPLGPRSLDSRDPAYAARCAGGVWERDTAYHQGTVWPWLAGPFVEAWVKVRGDGEVVRRQARARFLAPFYEHLGRAGLGHISEITDAESPHTPRGCPFQAWSLSELLRLELSVLRVDGALAAP